MSDLYACRQNILMSIFACSVAWAINKVCAKKKKERKEVKTDGRPTFPDLKLIRGVCEDGLLQVAVEECQFRFMTPSTQMVGSFWNLLTVCAKKKKEKI